MVPRFFQNLDGRQQLLAFSNRCPQWGDCSLRQQRFHDGIFHFRERAALPLSFPLPLPGLNHNWVTTLSTYFVFLFVLSYWRCFCFQHWRFFPENMCVCSCACIGVLPMIACSPPPPVPISWRHKKSLPCCLWFVDEDGNCQDLAVDSSHPLLCPLESMAGSQEHRFSLVQVSASHPFCPSFPVFLFAFSYNHH